MEYIAAFFGFAAVAAAGALIFSARAREAARGMIARMRSRIRL